MMIPRAHRKRRRRIFASIPSREKAGIRRKLFADQFGLCPVCDNSLDEEAAVFDHKTPIALGGRNGIDNLQLTHHECNKVKGQSTTEQARAEYKRRVGGD